MATRSETPDQRYFFKAHPTKAAWLSNREYQTRKGAEAHLAKITERYDPRRRVEYSVVECPSGLYRVLAVVKKASK